MAAFTVITCFTPQFDHLVTGLRKDCERLGYPLHCERIAEEFGNLIQAFDFKISFIRRMVDQLGCVLWLDAECRIVSPVPELWHSPLISTYKIGGARGFSSGVLMLNNSQREFIVLWEKYAQKYPAYPDDFVLDFLAKSMSMTFTCIPFEFYDRDTSSTVARGMWQNEHTIIQHPTINRWPDPIKYRVAFRGKQRSRRPLAESVSRQRKGLFYRNFGGEFAEVDRIMTEGRETEVLYADWVFDAVMKRYAPACYWPSLADDFTSKPRSFEISRRNFADRPAGRSHRESAIRSMRLDADDAQRYGHRLPSRIDQLWAGLRGFFSADAP